MFIFLINVSLFYKSVDLIESFLNWKNNGVLHWTTKEKQKFKIEFAQRLKESLDFSRKAFKNFGPVVKGVIDFFKIEYTDFLGARSLSFDILAERLWVPGSVSKYEEIEKYDKNIKVENIKAFTFFRANIYNYNVLDMFKYFEVNEFAKKQPILLPHSKSKAPLSFSWFWNLAVNQNDFTIQFDEVRITNHFDSFDNVPKYVNYVSKCVEQINRAFNFIKGNSIEKVKLRYPFNYEKLTRISIPYDALALSNPKFDKWGPELEPVREMDKYVTQVREYIAGNVYEIFKNISFLSDIYDILIEIISRIAYNYWR